MSEINKEDSRQVASPPTPPFTSRGEGKGGGDAVRELLEVAKDMANGNFSKRVESELYGELGELARYINITFKKLQTLEPNIKLSSEKIPMATSQLSDITRATEEATHRIMELTEKVLDNHDAISARLGKVKSSACIDPNETFMNPRLTKGNENQPLPTSPLTKGEENSSPSLVKEGDRGSWVDLKTGFSGEIDEIERLVSNNKNSLIEIITCLSFQDLTGQKINKIMVMIRDVESKILELIVTFGLKVANKEESMDEVTSPLLNELKRPVSDDLKQDLVDDMLKRFGF